LAKAFGVYGGYISAKRNLIDAIRSYSPGLSLKKPTHNTQHTQRTSCRAYLFICVLHLLLFVLLFADSEFVSGFIFTSSLPPSVTAGAAASVAYLKKSSVEREQQQQRVKLLKQMLKDAGIPILDTPSHIIPVMVGNAVLCKQISDRL
jgi:7-keto-8-aminopelargonate synthetase-like enzyme